MMNSEQLRIFAAETITRMVENSPENTLRAFDEKAWGAPLIGFAAGSDPLFASYKEMIGEFYWSPAEVMELEYPGETFADRDLSIICWVLPQTEATLADQRSAKELPSSRWVHSRHYGEFFNEHLRASLRDRFKEAGIRAAAPTIRNEFGYRSSVREGIASNWSERHTAYIAGMGTFGLSDGFITEKGKAVRLGSVIVEASIEPDIRTFKTRHDNCLFYSTGKCGACVRRCPVEAISEKGHDKQVCHDFIRAVAAPYAEKLLGAVQTPCGLCQAKVPCERQNPVRKLKEKKKAI